MYSERNGPYYNSDEGVAWGPLSLNEIKAELLAQKVTNTSNRRHSDNGHYHLLNPQDVLLVESDGMSSNEPTASEYFTANETNSNNVTRNMLLRAPDSSMNIINEDFQFTLNLTSSDVPDAVIVVNDSVNNISRNSPDSTRFKDFQYTPNSSYSESPNSENHDEDDVIVISESPSNCQEKEVIIMDDSTTSEEKSTNSNISRAGEMPQMYDLDNCSGATPSEQSQEETSDSFHFNDTLEEMEMAFKYGLDYEFPDEISKEQRTSSVNENSTEETTVWPPQKVSNNNKPCYNGQGETAIKPVKKIPLRKKAPATDTKYGYVYSPVGDYIRKKSPGKADEEDHLFKKPPKSIHHLPARLTPRPPCGARQPEHLKHIASPVGIYIKNSTTPIRSRIPVRDLPTEEIEQLLRVSSSSKQVDQANGNDAFPEVIYRRAKTTVSLTAKQIPFGPSIKKLIPEPVVTKHVKRIQRAVDPLEIRRKLEEVDISGVSSSVLEEDSYQDISYHITKQAFHK